MRLFWNVMAELPCGDNDVRSAWSDSVDFLRAIYNHIVVDPLSTTFSALSDPTRRSVVERLTHGPATVNELAEPFSMSQQAISKHLAYLERARLIKKRRQGRQHFCSLDPGAIRQVAIWAESYRRFWEESYERLDALLEEIKNQDGPKASSRPHKMKERKRTKA
jgi:DNA-binding transcriptional ArsR family regulator